MIYRIWRENINMNALFSDITAIQMGAFGSDDFTLKRTPTNVQFKAIYHPRHEEISTARNGNPVSIFVRACSILTTSADALNIQKDDEISVPGFSDFLKITARRDNGYGMTLLILREIGA